MHPQLDQVQIERYLKGQMVPVEVDIMESRMREDQVLMAEVKAFARINELSLPDREIFREISKPIANAAPEVSSGSEPFSWLWIAILLIVLAVIFYLVAI